MDERIPVEFKYEGKIYKGFFDQPLGIGSDVWHLSVTEKCKGKVGTYYWGALVIYAGDNWRMTNHKDDLLHLSDFFRDVILNWYQ